MKRRNQQFGFQKNKQSLIIKPNAKSGKRSNHSGTNLYTNSSAASPLLTPNLNTNHNHNTNVKASPNHQNVLPSYRQTNIDDGELPFKGPIKPAFILLNFTNFLTKEEEKEILQFKHIYYIRKQPPQSRTSVRQGSNYFKFTKDDHIAYRYQQQQVLGKGSFGSVLQCLDHMTGMPVAIKMMKNKPKVHSQIMFELELLKSLQTEEKNGHNIIKFIDSFDFRNFFCIVMELASFDLYTVLKNQRFRGFLIPVIQMVARDTAIALKYMHSKNIIHCDIKPENILFSTPENKSCKLIDFGCSCYVGKLMFTYIQSRYYRAPEVVFGFEYGTEIDIWSLGCVLCEMVTGQPIFPAEDETELIQMMVEILGMPPKSIIQAAPRGHHYFDSAGNFIQKPNSRGQLHIPSSVTISQATRIKDPLFLSLIDGCLKWNPHDRFTAETFLQHPWVKQKMNIKEDPPSTTRS